MSRAFQYFTIPVHMVSTIQPAPAAIWYACWSTTPPCFEPGMPSPLVAGATDGDLPEGAILLGIGAKDPPPPPPPPLVAGEANYPALVKLWLQLGRGADE